MLKTEKMGNMTSCGTVVKAALIVGSLFAYIIAIALNAILNIPGISPFNETIGHLSNKYDTGITPTNATFSIWGLIYFWQLVLVIYTMTLLCRKSGGTPLYVSPGFIPSLFFFSYIINLLGNPGWIFVFLQERNIAALGLLLVGLATLFICLYTSCKQLEASGSEMMKTGLAADIWCTRIIVQNGIALYLAWVSCAASINGVVVLHYNLDVSMSSACFGALVVLNCVLIAWFALETFMYDRQLRYVFGHYIGYIIAFVGIYKKNYDPNVSYTIYELVLLCFVSVLALVKLVVIIVKSIRDPIDYPSDYVKSKVYHADFEPVKMVYN